MPGAGAEETGNENHIWSHKWVFTGGPFDADGTKIFGYLTIPENCKIGVCAHELGHLLFGWPDLYDTDGSSEGLGNWCLMGGGSWNGSGDIPAHPSAWCKVEPGLGVGRQPHDQRRRHDRDVKSDQEGAIGCGRTARPARSTSWSRTGSASCTTGSCPGTDCSSITSTRRIDWNEDENHPFIRLLEADGRNHLHDGANRGDAGDPYPGSSKNVTLTSASNPSSKSYGGQDTFVTITNISASGANMKATITVKGPAAAKRVRRKRRRPKPPRRQARSGGDSSALDSSREFLELSERMQIAENWSKLRGRVEKWDPPKKAGDPGTLTIVVDHVDDVVGADGTRDRNMLSDTAGKTVRVTVPASAATQIQAQEGRDRRRQGTARKGARSILRTPRAHQVDVQVGHGEVNL